VLLTKSDLEKLMHLRLSEASKQLGLSATTVKKVCRTLGIYKWNNTSFREHYDGEDSPSPLSRSNTSAQDNTWGFKGVPAPAPVTDVMHIDHATAPVKIEPDSLRTANQSFLDDWRACEHPTRSHISDIISFSSMPEDAAAAHQRSSVATPPSSPRISASSEMPDLVSSDTEEDDDFVSLTRCAPPHHLLNKLAHAPRSGLCTRSVL
jgi:hypothetical protein